MLTLPFVVLNYTRCGIFGEITQPHISEQVVGYLKSVACALKCWLLAVQRAGLQINLQLRKCAKG